MAANVFTPPPHTPARPSPRLAPGRRTQALNASGSDAVLAALERGSLKALLAAHWDAVTERHAPLLQQQGQQAGQPNGVTSFEDLWQLMLHVHAATAAAGGPGPAAAPTASAAAGFSPAVAAAADAWGASVGAVPPTAAAASSVSNTSDAWRSYVRGRGLGAVGAAAACGTPPYAGARPVLRFTQALVLGPSSSTGATSAATHGLPPAHAQGSLDDAPQNRAVELRVAVSDLRREAGLSVDGMRHLLDVCGRDRVDAAAGEVVLWADRYPRREENRRLLLEQLHLLIEEAHRHAPRPDGYVFDRAASPFLAAA
eukprot:360016-Chlamydomonas_euryale.AAC.1